MEQMPTGHGRRNFWWLSSDAETITVNDMSVVELLKQVKKAMQVEEFISFDSRQRSLASSIGLRVAL